MNYKEHYNRIADIINHPNNCREHLPAIRGLIAAFAYRYRKGAGYEGAYLLTTLLTQKTNKWTTIKQWGRPYRNV